MKAAIEKIPADRRRIITTHDAFGYFAAAYGVTFIAPQGVSTEAEVSAKDVARIITQIRKQKIPAVFLENVTDKRLLERIGAESGARIGGTLYSDALTDEKGAGADLSRHDAAQREAARRRADRADSRLPPLSPPVHYMSARTEPVPCPTQPQMSDQSRKNPRHGADRLSRRRQDDACSTASCPSRTARNTP